MIDPTRNDSSAERSARGDAAASTHVSRMPNGFMPLAERARKTTVRPSPWPAGGLPGSRNSMAPGGLIPGRQNVTVGVRRADKAGIASMSIPEELRPIVKGLSLGKSDVTVSRLLGMSPRTFSRKVAELLSYLGVETRFQAGVELARRGVM